MGPLIDAHQYFWSYGTSQTSWIEAAPYAGDSVFQPLRRSFEPDDLAPELQAAGVGYTVAIEAADDLAENEALLSNARRHQWIAGVVGWAPLANPIELERKLTFSPITPTRYTSGVHGAPSRRNRQPMQ